MSAPDPLVPAEVDLRGLEYMPLFGNHLLGSEFHAASDDTAWRAGVTLWWRAWNQVPAASLPNDDAALARLADLGKDVKAWKVIRERALHGFTLCSDGRLYHAFLAKQAIVAWTKRVKDRARKRKWREGQDADATGTNSGTERQNEHGQDAGHDGDKGRDRTTDVNRRDGNVNLNTPVKHSIESSNTGANPERLAALRSVCQHAERFQLDAKAELHLRQWASEGVTEQHLADAIAIARERKPNGEILYAAYVATILPDVRSGSAPSAPMPREQLIAEAKRLTAERERRELLRMGGANAAG